MAKWFSLNELKTVLTPYQLKISIVRTLLSRIDHVIHVLTRVITLCSILLSTSRIPHTDIFMVDESRVKFYKIEVQLLSFTSYGFNTLSSIETGLKDLSS